MKYLQTKKDKIKFIRSIFQGIILLLLIRLLFNVIFDSNKYEPFDDSLINEDKGFIALSYFGVDREGTNTMISTERLEEHFEALNKNGYVTLTQKDIEYYYKNNKSLPERSMFLMFEDGRRDTAIFSSNLLEKYNYIGTTLNYGNTFEEKDPKFLMEKDLKKLEKSTFWEIGTNGYRLAYINVFDRYNNYLGELNPVEFSALSKYIGRNYNHYLMDFIRDENKIPKESYDQMKERIEKDYILMDKIYKEKLGKLPKTYVIMHSNTGGYGSNKNVSAVNETMIYKHFIMNFNREGFSLNKKETNIYDLTRIQPQAYWYPNHLLMRIKSDTNEDIIFMEGDPNIKRDWDTISGVAEFRKSSIILTSEPRGKGLIRLKNSSNKDYALHTTLTGNVLGTQTIYLRADEGLKNYIAIKLKNNNLYIEDNDKEIFSLDLEEHDGVLPQSIEENQLEALNHEYKVYNKNIKKQKNKTKMEPQREVEIQEVKSVEDGAERFVKELQINELGNRKLDIYLKDNKLSIDIDHKEVIKDLSISTKNSDYIYLESAWEEYGYSQRNIADDVYDGVFENIIITNIHDENNIIYINKLQGKELVKDNILNIWNKIINWFIINL
ncbi:glycoside hydrolase [Tissierella pigra]|uniref:Glycoside hydrolase n=1 Tax=Tissierella pigra TaxID=2607614 RepID=A0A6N7XZZ4_9FIRM|nr:glycoside hydrolase [Tissierella pigra]MBU5428074.1 glycoside hydrolase [Tissierella pigra]MSU02045.1 glycoside hydrolase [Tissierella pigra]